MSETTKSTASGRWTLIALALLFIGPLAVAWTLYMTGMWRPGAGANHGELVDPIVTLPRDPMPLLGGGTADGGYLYGKWSIVHVAVDDCPGGCEAALIKTRQIRQALGRETERIRRVLFVSGSVDHYDTIAHPELLVVQLTGAAGNTIKAALQLHGGSGRIFLVDPLGNLMLHYALDVPPADIRDDLKRLLRVSRIG